MIRMGCAPSLLEESFHGDETKPDPLSEFVIESDNPEDIIVSYIGLDREIGRFEQSSPAPRFGRAVAAHKQLNALLAAFENASHFHDNVECYKEDEDVQKLFIELGLHKSPAIAHEHEEFIANANRTALEYNRIKMVKKLLLAVEEELEQCSSKINYLQKLYLHQESLLMNVFGASYGSEKEKSLEQETDTMHNFRDTLAIGVLQWEQVERDLKSASILAQRGMISWKSLKKQSIERKLALAADARNNIQEAAFLVHRTHDILPGVQFPYCSEREIRAILHAIEYIFTDILIDDRFSHALKVYENFQHRIGALHAWVIKTMDSSIRKDLGEFDAQLVKIARKLRNERISQICLKLKIPNNYTDVDAKLMPQNTSMYQQPMKPESRYTTERRYKDVITPKQIKSELTHEDPSLDQIFTDPNLQRDFERKLAARRSAMWPSRRMEELRQYTMPQN